MQHDLELRIASLEREAKRLRGYARFALIVAAGLLANSLHAAVPVTRTTGTTLRAPLRVVDRRGKLLLVVDATPEGARLTTFDSAGRRSVALDAMEFGGSVGLWNTSKEIGAVFANSTHGGIVGLNTTAGRQGLLLGVADGDAEVSLYNSRTGATRTTLKVNGDYAGFGVTGPDGRPALIGGGTPTGGHFSLFDAQGNGNVEINSSSSGGSLVIKDAAGKAIFSRPEGSGPH